MRLGIQNLADSCQVAGPGFELTQEFMNYVYYIRQ